MKNLNLRHIWQKHFHLWLYALADEGERLYRLRVYDEQVPDYVGCHAIGRVKALTGGGAFLDIGGQVGQAFMRKAPQNAKIGELLPLLVDRHLPDDKGLRVVLDRQWQEAETLLQNKDCRPQILPAVNFLQKILLEMPPIKAPILFTESSSMKMAEQALADTAEDLRGDFALAEDAVNVSLLQAERRGLLDNPQIFGEGARLFVDEATAATIIDIDSGADMGAISKGDILSLNLQAAEEVMRLIGALDLAGVIAVDFIRMKNPQDRRRLIDGMKTLNKRLCLSCDILGYSNAGFMEILRRRRRLSLKRSMAYDAVPMALIELSSSLRHHKHGTLQLTANGKTIEALQKHHSDILNSLSVQCKSDETVAFPIVESL